MDQTLVIYNSHAGSGGVAERVRALVRQRRDMQLAETHEPGDALRLAKQACAQGFSRIIAAGGDGTIHEVVNGVMQAAPGEAAERDSEPASPVIGILPCGSANDFAKAIGVQVDFDAAVAVIDADHVRQADTVRIEGSQRRLMINAGTGGLSVAVNEHMDEATKKFWGGFAYARVAAEVLPEARQYDVRLRVDGRELEGRYGGVVIANGGWAGNLPLVPEARIDDGALNLLAVRAETFGEWAGVLAEFALGWQSASEWVDCLTGKRVEVESDPAMPFISDGERLGETPLTFQIQPASVRVLAAGARQSRDAS